MTTDYQTASSSAEVDPFDLPFFFGVPFGFGLGSASLEDAAEGR